MEDTQSQQRDSAHAIIREARALGFELRADITSGKVLFRPKGIMPPDLYHRLIAHKPEVLALLSTDDPEVAWRVAAMRRQCPRTGRVLFLTARAFAWSLEDALAAVNGLAQPRCLSCGDPVDEVRRPRCTPCAEAAMIVLNEVREGVQDGQAGKDGQAA